VAESRDYSEPLNEIEALVRQAGNYVRASDDLRPRVLESARAVRNEYRVQRWLWQAAFSVALLGMLMAIPLSVISGSTRVGRWLSRIGLLATPEELQVPEIVSRRDALCSTHDSPAGDALGNLASDEAARNWHIELNPPPPERPRGDPDPDQLMAKQKIREARSRDEALRYLSARERLYVAADAQLLHQLSGLPP
jgi:membrane glycosyltransferase